MALQVWLPLNGNLNNQGLANVTVTNNGATVNDGGKIGKCYAFGDGNASDKGININNNLTSLGSKRSICAWVNPKGNHYHYSGAIASSGNWNNIRWAFCLQQNNQGFTGFDSGYSLYYSTDIPTNTWTHLCVTVDNGVTKFYKNGVYLGQQSRGSGTLTSDASNTMIGRETYASGYFTFNGDICDVRIYDHCLSPKEVKDISKGLILHYKLDDEGVESTTNLVTSLSPGDRTTVSNGVVTATGETADTYFTINLSEDIVIGTQYTISCYVEMPEGCNWNFPLGAQGNTSLDWYLVNGYNTKTFTANSIDWGTKRIFMDDNGGTARGQGIPCKFYNFQLEKKDHATSFVGYGQTRNASVAYDSSGYKYDGIVNGTLSVNTDTPRYDRSTVFTAGQNYHIISPAIPKTDFQNSYTISWWSKTSDMNGRMAWGSSEGNRLNLYPSNGYFCWNTGDGASNAIKNGSTSVAFAPYQGAWHHYAMVGDGTNGNLYIDGTYVGKATTYKPLNSSVIYLSGWNSSTEYTWGGNIVDFRMYSTALSADDIKELYDTSAYICNNGTVCGYEFIEGSSQDIKKSGIVESATFEEGVDVAAIYSNNIKANQIIEI